MESYSIKNSELLVFENAITQEQNKKLIDIFYTKTKVGEKNNHHDDRSLIEIDLEDVHSANFVIADTLVELIQIYNKKYKTRFYYLSKNTPLNFSMTNDEKTTGLPVHYDIMKIDTGIHKRLFGVVLYLTDDFIDGEIVFPLLDFAWKPKAGTLLTFPSHYGYPHFVRASRGKDRIIFQGYITYGI